MIGRRHNDREEMAFSSLFSICTKASIAALIKNQHPHCSDREQGVGAECRESAALERDGKYQATQIPTGIIGRA